MDAQSRFWAINMFYPGEEELAVVEDPIARLDSLGLLIVTDKFPETMLGFVPFPN